MASRKTMPPYRFAFWFVTVVLIICIVSALGLFHNAIYYKLGIELTNIESSKPYISVLPAKYYQDSSQILKYSYDKHVHSIEDFDAWKNRLVPIYKSYITDASATTNHTSYDGMMVTLLHTEDQDGYTVEKYSFPSSGANDNLFYKLIPDVESDKAILALSGMGDQGFNDVIGEPTKWSLFYYQDEIGKKLVLEGYTVYAPEWYGAGERGLNFDSCKKKEFNCNNHTFIRSLGNYGISVEKIRADDLYRITAIIDSEFDRVGVVGLSLGGSGAIQTILLNPGVYDAVVTASAVSSIHEQYAEGYLGNDMLRYYDNRDLLATIAPKPLYISFGINEHRIKDFEGVTKYTIDYVRNAYVLLDAEESFVSIIHDGGHEYDVESLIRFLNKNL